MKCISTLVTPSPWQASQRRAEVEVDGLEVRRVGIGEVRGEDLLPVAAQAERLHLLTQSIPLWILGLFICREDGRIVEGNEFFVSFRRAHGGQSTWQLEDLAVS